MSESTNSMLQSLLGKIQSFVPKVSPFAVLILCLCVTFFGFIGTFHLVQQDEELRFQNAAKSLVGSIRQRLEIYENVLLATRNLFATNPNVTRTEFSQFVSGFQIQERYPGIQGIGFTQRVPSRDLESHQESVRRSGFPQYAIWPGHPREEYFSIIYLEPFDWRNQRAFGYDMSSESVRRQAMQKARDTGSPAASGKVTLVQEYGTKPQSGFLLYVPVYFANRPVETVEQKRAALKGFVYSPFRAGDLFSQISGDFQSEISSIRFAIYDGDLNTSENQIFKSADYEEDVHLRNQIGYHTLRTQISFAGHGWTVVMYSTPQFGVRSERVLPYFILILGTLISFLVYFILQFANRLNENLRHELVTTERAQREILAAHKVAEEANHAKSRFLANISHEIRTPLGIIMGFADLALDNREVSDEVREYLKAIRRNGRQLLTLIGEVLDLSKIEANKLEVEKVRFSLPNTLGEVISSMSVRAREKGIHLVWDDRHPIPECVTTDPTKLRQILMNVIGNAIKFTEKGEVRVIPQLVSEPQPDSEIELEFLIQDTGIGIPVEQQDRLFQAFSQADASTTRRYGGTGLGLALSQQLARAMGGDLKLVKTEPGHGSTFSVRINGGPFENLWSPQPALDISGKTLAFPTARVLKHKKILLVEDSPDNQTLVSRYLKSEGASVDVASDGLEALEKVRHGPYDLVLMDIQMPRMDGHSATRILRESGFQKPIIALTAHAFSEEREKALQEGFDSYLTKPVGRKTLVEEILRATHGEAS